MVTGLIGYMVGDAGAIWKTTDGGLSWSYQGSGVSNNLNAVSFSDTTHGIAVGDGGIILTTNDGLTWTKQKSTTSLGLLGCSMNSTSLAYVCGRNGIIYTSVDGGVTWTGQASGTSNDLFSICINPATPAKAVAVGETGTTVYTTNSGTLWTVVPVGILGFNSVSIDPTGTNIFVVGYNATIQLSVDGGLTYTAQISPVASVTLTCVQAISATVANICGAAGTILTTSNAGTLWTAQTPAVAFAASQFNAISYGSSTHGIAVGEGGVSDFLGSVFMVTDNGGILWGTGNVTNPATLFGYIYAYNMTAIYLNTYGTPGVGEQIFVKVKQASQSTGYTNSPGNSNIPQLV